MIVVGLIGERGREVKEFVEGILGKEGIKRAVVVATPADNPPLLRLHGALIATSIAEYFRDQGKHVLLLMDSLTRVAQAQREIGLAIGEPPTTKGYPPSVFAKLPQLVERAGNGGKNGGSITGFYTVLTEGDDHNDPVADASRAILDGHIVLSRSMASAGWYPPVDVLDSLSRLMPAVTAPAHRSQAMLARRLLAAHTRSEDLIRIGAYKPGMDAELDRAMRAMPGLREFLEQGSQERVTIDQTVARLHAMEL